MSEIWSCGYLTAVQAKADQAFVDGIYKNDVIADVETAKAVLSQQQGMFRMPSLTNTKNEELTVEWLTKCTVETSDCTDDCTITGTPSDPECQTYELECLQETAFQVSERVYRKRTIEKEDDVAYLMLRHMRAMDQYVAQYIITGLLANLGANALGTYGIGVVAGTTTFIAPQYWDDSIWGYFNQVVRMNKFRSPYLITGNNLYQLLFNRPLEAGTGQDLGGYRKMGTMTVYQDPENIETYAPAQTFLIHKGSVAFLNKPWYPVNAANAVNPAPGYYLYSIESYNLPGIYYDVIVQQSCSNNDFHEATKLQLHGLFVANPYTCDDDTGVLVFECGTSS